MVVTLVDLMFRCLLWYVLVAFYLIVSGDAIVLGVNYYWWLFAG